MLLTPGQQLLLASLPAAIASSRSMPPAPNSAPVSAPAPVVVSASILPAAAAAAAAEAYVATLRPLVFGSHRFRARAPQGQGPQAMQVGSYDDDDDDDDDDDTPFEHDLRSAIEQSQGSVAKVRGQL